MPTAAGERQRLGVLFPVLAAALILVFSTRRSPEVTTGKFYIAAAVIAALVLVACTVIWKPPAVPAPLRWAGLFALLCLANFPIALMQGIGAITWARLALIVICLPGFAWGAWMLGENAARVLYWVILAVCGGITVYYLSFWVQTQSLDAVRTDYANALWTETGGVFASVITACMLLPFALRPGRRWTAAAFVLALTAIAATFSRTFWIMTPAALAVTVALMNRRRLLKARRILLMGALASVIALAAGGVLFTAMTARVTTAGLSGTQRLYESQAILSTMRGEPHTFVAGAGFGAEYTETAVDTSPLAGGLGTNIRDFSHDFYLQLLWNTGLLGLGAWAAALLSWLRVTARSASPYVMGCFAAVLAITLGSFTYQPFGDLGWDVAFGLLLGLGCRLAQDQMTRPTSDYATMTATTTPAAMAAGGGAGG